MLGVNSFLSIQGWMIEGLGLSGNELIIYAVIFGMCQDGTSKIISNKFLLSWIPHCKTRNLQYIIKKLIDKNAIVVYRTTARASEYSINIQIMKEAIKTTYIKAEKNSVDELHPEDYTLSNIAKDTVLDCIRKNDRKTPEEIEKENDIRKVLDYPWPYQIVDKNEHF